jgi:peptidoglycan hydrolase-like amidase
VDSVIEMQVAVVDGVAAVNFATSEPAALVDADGKVVGQLEANAGYTARLEASTIAIGDSQFSSGLQIDPGLNGVTQIADRQYRGRMVLVLHKDSLWVVNHVNLRKYLHSVVASEVSPNWQANALKAQAIAARSYALTYYFRPVSDFYHLGDDEYYQVYSGIAREAPETNQAVDATAGQYVSYKGGIVESLYAASDDIVAEAFQGHGMSQLGALDRANQGYKYEQILSHYYPGTAVGRIVLDHE